MKVLTNPLLLLLYSVHIGNYTEGKQSFCVKNKGRKSKKYCRGISLVLKLLETEF